jgi:hypothetical protein
MSKHNKPASISQITKCIKNNKHNVKINLNSIPQFEQSIEFKIYREPKVVAIETSLASKEINEDKHTLCYKLNEILDIPRKLNESFDMNLDSNYYIFGVPKEDSFFYSLLYVISKDFKLKKEAVRSNYVISIKEELRNSVNKLFKQNNYGTYGYKRGVLSDNITNSDKIHESLMCLVSDYFGINLLVLNYDQEKYWIGKEYNNAYSEKNVIIIYSNGVYLPLIHIFGEFPNDFIYKCIINRFKVFNKLEHANMTHSFVEQQLSTPVAAPAPAAPVAPVAQVAQQLSAQQLSAPETSNNITKLKTFSGYKLPELQSIASTFNISFNHSVNGKDRQKTKRMLYDEIKALL